MKKAINMMPQNVMILMATFNGENWISEQINSILNQVPSVEVDICISDDGSADKTINLIETVALKNKNIRFLTHNQRSGSAAQNFFRLFRGADFSSAQYIALSDQDDVWLPSKLSRAITQLNENHADAYSSNVTAFWPNGKQQLINKAQPQCAFDYMFESAGPGCTFVLTQKLALTIQQFLIAHQDLCSGVALHDWFIYAFARSHGFKWVIDHESHMLYRQHATNVVGANVGLAAKLHRLKKLREGWLFDQAVLIAEILGYTEVLPIQKVKNLSIINRLWLILNVKKLRRRLRDRVALIGFLILIIK